VVVASPRVCRARDNNSAPGYTPAHVRGRIDPSRIGVQHQLARGEKQGHGPLSWPDHDRMNGVQRPNARHAWGAQWKPETRPPQASL
jgi:hypothetical protein